jgi:hypothetical protein
MMRNFVLGVALCMVFGLPANAAGLSGSKAAEFKHTGVRSACHWVAADRTLRLISQTAMPVNRSTAKAPLMKASPAVTTRTTPVHVGWQPTQRVALIVGIAY